ncbi:Gfo/Idh/MocA family oxidoreductase [Candidatus Woesearchaeota archaeon]|nr:Gfo/Idh/MocA family oxidoreductase [Candidatus Woesearchaeota archaeon]
MQGVIIGYGNTGKIHYQRYKNLDVRIPVVVEIDPKQQSEATDRKIKVVSSLAEVKENIAFIDICTPTNQHFQNIQEALPYNVPVLVENPVVRTQEEVTALREMGDIHLIVAEAEMYNLSFLPYLLVNTKPRQIRMERKVNLEMLLDKAAELVVLNEEKSGGIVLDLMVHDISLLIAKYGKPEIKSVTASSTKYPCTDQVEIKLEAGNIPVTLYGSWIEPRRESPITAEIQFDIEGKAPLRWRCASYVSKRPARKDPYQREMKAFLDIIKRESIQRTRKTGYNLSVYLDAVEVALDINAAMQKK